MKFTVLGASGFIGSHLSRYLLQQGHECFTPARGDPSIYTQHLGHVIYCIGLTADFRTRPFDTVRAYVSVLTDVLERAQFESFLYLSSTRVYGNSSAALEDTPLQATSQNPSDLYNLSKLIGESLTLCCGKPSTRVVRLSNVYGNDVASENFLTSIVRDAVFLEGPDHGFNMVAVKDVSLLSGNDFRLCRNVSPKYLRHKDPALHHPVGGL